MDNCAVGEVSDLHMENETDISLIPLDSDFLENSDEDGSADKDTCLENRSSQLWSCAYVNKMHTRTITYITITLTYM